MDDAQLQPIMDEIIEVLRNIYDPEIPVNIYDLGLVYKIDLEETGNVRIDMTLTSPACPVAEALPEEVRDSVGFVEGVKDVNVEIIWDPPWNYNMMSEEARLELGMM